MPEYLAPGVYVEETSFRSKSIEGVSTTTTGFIGPARFGPVDLEPELITSLGEFERSYGGSERLDWGDGEINNYLWHAARGFFTEGGRRLYVSRIFRALGAASTELSADGHASVSADAAARGLPVIASVAPGSNGLDVIEALFGTDWAAIANGATLAAGQVQASLALTGGNDGQRPGATKYEGQDDPNLLRKTGLKQFEALEDISIVAAPGDRKSVV